MFPVKIFARNWKITNIDINLFNKIKSAKGSEDLAVHKRRKATKEITDAWAQEKKKELFFTLAVDLVEKVRKAIKQPYQMASE